MKAGTVLPNLCPNCKVTYRLVSSYFNEWSCFCTACGNTYNISELKPINKENNIMPIFRVSYHSAVYAVAWGMHRRGELSDSDFATVKAAIADQPKSGSTDLNNDNCLCPQLEQLSYDTGVTNGVIDATKQPLKTINWAGLLAFIQALMPIILQFIAILNPPKPVPTPSLVAGNG